jgi:hypothetical protein
LIAFPTRRRHAVDERKLGIDVLAQRVRRDLRLLKPLRRNFRVELRAGNLARLDILDPRQQLPRNTKA